MDLAVLITSGRPAAVLAALGGPDVLLDDGRRPLSLAAAANRVPVVDALLGAGYPIDGADATDLAYTPLIWAVRERAPDALRRLLEAGADVRATESIGGTPLHHAAVGGVVDTVRTLIAAGAPVDARDDNGKTSLIRMAVQVGATELRRVRDDGTEGPPEFPLSDEHRAVLDVLADAGADLDLLSAEGWSAAHHAAANGAQRFLARLLERGARADVVHESLRYTPLHAAADNGRAAAVAALLAAGAAADPVDVHGFTPLHGAAVEGAADVVALLLDAGADRGHRVVNGYQRVRAGTTAAGIAREHGHADLADLLAAGG